MLGLDRGEIAAPRLRMRLDRAELLIATALLVGSERAITAAERAIGSGGPGEPAGADAADRAERSDPRDAQARIPSCSPTLRDEAIARAPEPSADDVRLERLRPRSVISLVAATFAVYVLAGQLGDVDFGTVISSIDWVWAAGAAAHLDADLRGCGAGDPAVRAGAHPGAPVADDAVRRDLRDPGRAGGGRHRGDQRPADPTGRSPVGSGARQRRCVDAGRVRHHARPRSWSSRWSRRRAPRGTSRCPSEGVLIGGGVVLALMVLAFVVPVSRRIILARLRPTWENIGPRLLDILRNPTRLAAGPVAASSA